MERHGPAGELVAGLAVGGVDEEAVGLDVVGFLFGIEGDEAEAAAFLVGLLVAVGCLPDDEDSCGRVNVRLLPLYPLFGRSVSIEGFLQLLFERKNIVMSRFP